MSRIESRLGTIEEALSLIIDDLDKRNAASAQDAAIPTSKPPVQPSTGQHLASEPSVQVAAQAPSPAASGGELRARRPRPVAKPAAAGNWLGTVAVLCFILAAGFIVKLAVESGWLTPDRQIGLSSLLGLVLITAGFILRQTDREYASYLPGAGIAVLYLSVFAAHSIHHLISTQIALALTSVVSVLCIGVYTQIRHDIYLFTAALGSYLFPVLLGTSAQTDFSIYYFVACSMAFAGVAIWIEARLLAVVASYLAIVMTTMIGLSIHDDISVAFALAFQFVIFVGGTAVHSVLQSKPLKGTEAWSFFPVLLIFYACEYFFINRIAPAIAPWASLGFAGFLVAIYFASKRELKDLSLDVKDMILAYVAIVLFHSLYLELLTDDIRPWLFVAIVGVMIARPGLIGKARGGIGIPAIGIGLILFMEYVRIAFHLIGEQERPMWLLVGFTAAAGVFALYLVRKDEIASEEQTGYAVLGAAHGLAILGFYRLFEGTGSLAVSAAWLMYALMIVGVGFGKRDPLLARSALLVLALAAGKALLYDAASAPTVLRIVCLLLTGVVLYACGLVLRKIASWEKNRGET